MIRESLRLFLDEAGQLFYSTVFSAAEPESHYVLDGLTHNEVIIPNAHSTDTHGFSELVFAITGLLNIEFRPRFAGFTISNYILLMMSVHLE